MINFGVTISINTVITIQNIYPILSYFTARSCDSSNPPEPFLGIDIDWPQKSRVSGTKVTYTCPYKKITNAEWLTGNFDNQYNFSLI